MGGVRIEQQQPFHIFKRVWVGVGIKEQQPFYLFSEGQVASGGLTTAVISSI